MKLLTHALREFLARNDIDPLGEKSVSLVIVAQDVETMSRIKRAIRAEGEPLAFLNRSHFENADIVVNDVPVLVTMPKKAVVL